MSIIESNSIQKRHISYPQDKTLRVGGSEKKHKLEDLVRKRRGGRGKSRLSRDTKVKMILDYLPNSSLLSSKTAYNPGRYMAEIVNIFPSSNWNIIPSLVNELCDTNVVTSREGEKHERPEKFFYRTEEAIDLLDQLEKIRSKFHS